MSDKVNDFLEGLTLAQLTKLQVLLNEKVAAEAVRRAQPGRLPPIPKSDVASLAESLGLDISSLLRDVKKKSS